MGQPRERESAWEQSQLKHKDAQVGANWSLMEFTCLGHLADAFISLTCNKYIWDDGTIAREDGDKLYVGLYLCWLGVRLFAVSHVKQCYLSGRAWQ